MTDTQATAPNTPEEERFTVSAKFLDGLMKRVEDQALERGRREATAIELGEDFGTASWLTVITAPSRTQLRRMVAERRWRNEGDNPGSAYCGTCDVLRITRRNNQWRAIVIVSTHYDV